MLRRLWLTLMRSLRSPISWRFQSRAAGCAAVTTFSALRHSGDAGATWLPSWVSAASAYLGVQFANSLGFRTVAITRHRQGGALLKLGAHYFIDSATDDVTEAFNHSGGVQPR